MQGKAVLAAIFTVYPVAPARCPSFAACPAPFLTFCRRIPRIIPMPRITSFLGSLLLCLALNGQQVEDLGLSPEQLEDKLLVLVNQERSSRGLSELRFDPLLREMARAHSRRMAAENKLAHDFPGYEKLDERAARAGVYFSKLGENVARSETFVIRFFHEALLVSPEHRENILDGEFTHLGVGIEKSGATYFVTQEFGRLFAPLSREEAEREMEKKLMVRFNGRMPLPEGAANEIKELCRRSSALFLQGQPPLEIPAALGSAAMLNLNFTELEAGLLKILGELRGQRPLYWTLGVTFGRSPRNPGGTYALSLLLFSDLRDALDLSNGMDAFVLRALNAPRGLASNSRLARLATEISRAFYSSPGAVLRSKAGYKLFSVYQTDALNLVPADIAKTIGSNANIRSIGIDVFYPLAEGLLGNYFIVAILGDKKLGR